MLYIKLDRAWKGVYRLEAENQRSGQRACDSSRVTGWSVICIQLPALDLQVCKRTRATTAAAVTEPKLPIHV